jgi:hypothetical protein
MGINSLCLSQSKKEIIAIQNTRIDSLKTEIESIKLKYAESESNLKLCNSARNDLFNTSNDLGKKLNSKENEVSVLSLDILTLKSSLEKERIQNKSLTDSLSKQVTKSSIPISAYKYGFDNSTFPIIELKNKTIEKQINKDFYYDCFGDDLGGKSSLKQKLDSITKVLNPDNRDNYPDYVCDGFKVNYFKNNVLSIELYKSFITGPYPTSETIVYNLDLQNGTTINLASDLTPNGINYIKQLVFLIFKIRMNEVKKEMQANGNDWLELKGIWDSSSNIKFESIDISKFKLVNGGIIVIVELGQFPHVVQVYNPSNSYFISWHDLFFETKENTDIRKIALSEIE